jgi:hypothetical protein
MLVCGLVSAIAIMQDSSISLAHPRLKLLSRYNPVKGLLDSWLTPDPYREGGTLL